MQLLQRVLLRLNGLKYSQEYLCLAKEQFTNPLYVYLIGEDNHVVKDITSHHLFIGYNPLIFVLFENSPSHLQTHLIAHIVFCTKAQQFSEITSSKDVVARLIMQKINQFTVEENIVYYFHGMHGNHSFQNLFHKSAFRLNNLLFNNKNGNVYLKGNLYQQVQMAYAIPRTICLVTVEIDGQYNLFPTDLHGAINSHYIISLRKHGKACKQVETTGKILLSDVDVSARKTAYALGKNHMEEPKPQSSFNFLDTLSNSLHLPIPEGAVFYRELILQSSETCGIHKLFLFKILDAQQLIDNPATLSHIHSSYATWRKKRKIATEYFLR